MRDTVQGWQQAGRPNGLPVDLQADRALSDAVQHLTAAAGALEPSSGFTNPPAGGTHLSIDAMGRTRVQAAASPADRTAWCRTPAWSPKTAPRASGACWYTRWSGPSETR
jgi:hypothetical protein